MRPDSHDFDDETVIQYVISYMTCGVCGASYRLQDVEVIDGDDAMWAMVAHCPLCGEEGLILAFASPLEEEDVWLDQAPDDWWEAGLEPLTKRDVAEWRAFLEAFHGDMEDLLAEGQNRPPFDV